MTIIREPSFLVLFLIEAKFYSLFSLLFGVGFAVFVQRAAARGADAARLFKRRLTGLLIIGLVHTFLIWMGAAIAIFYGIGFGLFGRVPLVVALVGAIAFFILQLIVSRAWLARAAFGPVEWLWRMFTYRRRVPLFR